MELDFEAMDSALKGDVVAPDGYSYVSEFVFEQTMNGKKIPEIHRMIPHRSIESIRGIVNKCGFQKKKNPSRKKKSIADCIRSRGDVEIPKGYKACSNCGSPFKRTPQSWMLCDTCKKIPDSDYERYSPNHRELFDVEI